MTEPRPQYVTFDDVYEFTPEMIRAMLELRQTAHKALIEVERQLVDLNVIKPGERWAFNQSERRQVYAVLEAD